MGDADAVNGKRPANLNLRIAGFCRADRVVAPGIDSDLAVIAGG
jgi:hypothetical protein